MSLDRVLLHIIHFDPYMRALRDLIIFQFTEPDENIHVSTPKIDEEQQGVENNRCHETQHWHEFLAVEYFGPKIMVEGSSAESDGQDVEPQIYWRLPEQLE